MDKFKSKLAKLGLASRHENKFKRDVITTWLDDAGNYEDNGVQGIYNNFNNAGGMSSGNIGHLISNNNVKKYYIKFMDEVEETIEDAENEYGETFKNDKHLPHYVWRVWLAYEIMMSNIAREIGLED